MMNKIYDGWWIMFMKDKIYDGWCMMDEVYDGRKIQVKMDNG